MILHYARLQRFPTVFKSLTGLRVPQFDDLVADVLPRYHAAERQRLSRPTRQRAIGAGHPFELDPRNQILLTVIWLRVYPIHEVLAYLFGISDTTVSRIIARVLPLLEASGRDTMRLPDPGRKRRRQLDALLADTPDLAVVIDTFEQPVQRHKDRKQADTHYSGKKKRHTLKSQVAVDEETGDVADVAESAPGPTADIKLLEQSQLLERLPAGVGGLGDLAYVGPRDAQRASKEVVGIPSNDGRCSCRARYVRCSAGDAYGPASCTVGRHSHVRRRCAVRPSLVCRGDPPGPPFHPTRRA